LGKMGEREEGGKKGVALKQNRGELDFRLNKAWPYGEGGSVFQKYLDADKRKRGREKSGRPSELNEKKHPLQEAASRRDQNKTTRK